MIRNQKCALWVYILIMGGFLLFLFISPLLITNMADNCKVFPQCPLVPVGVYKSHDKGLISLSTSLAYMF